MRKSMFSTGLTRRSVLKSTAASAALAVPGTLGMPFLSRAADRPVITHGLQSGDVRHLERHDLGARRPAVAHACGDLHHRRVREPAPLPPLSALPDSDFAVKRLLENLPADQDIFYRVAFADLADPSILSEPMVGHLRTAPASRRSVKFVWSGDTAGQGWGIDLDRGGMTHLRPMRRQPAGLLHPFRRHHLRRRSDRGRNGDARRRCLEKPRRRGVHKVAETLDEFRGNYKYNLLDQQRAGLQCRGADLLRSGTTTR